MESFKVVVTQCWFRLIPFAVCFVLYAVFVQFTEKGVWWTATTKCAPIVSLMFFIAFFGFNNLQLNTYPRKILAGLVFSCMGDALLDFNLFEFGVAAFLVAQIFYIWAFGWTPYMWWIGVILYLFASALTGVLLSHLDPISTYGLPIYALFLTTMSWRALARIWNIEDGSFLLVRIICGIASLLFVISDTIIAIDRFLVDIPHSGYYIMLTYYAAQLGIALSILPPNEKDTRLLINDSQATPSTFQPEVRNADKSSRLTD